MARIKLKHAQLLSDVKSFGSDSFEPVRKVVRKTSTLTKSAPGSLAQFFAKAEAAGGKVTIRETGVKTGDPIHVKGKEARTAKQKADPGANAEPPEHPGIRVAKAINEMRAHAMGKDINGPVTPAQSEACKLLARTGRLEPAEVDDVEAALNDGRALSLRRRHGWQNNRLPMAVQTSRPHEKDQEEVGCFKN